LHQRSRAPTSTSTASERGGTPLARWKAIHSREHAVVAIERETVVPDRIIRALLAEAPFTHIAEGKPDEIVASLVTIPPELKADICGLAADFAATMSVTSVRVKLKAVTTNACCKVHSDFTDVRLISTYAGHGTDYVADPREPDRLSRMSTEWIGLFKGRAYGDGHPVCLHRSPPIEGTGEARLVLVIDTPAFATQMIDPAYPDLDDRREVTEQAGW
ncbi:MAG: DUF1826 domain-containing protein, partial [Pseudomonadota bacterium]